MKIRLFMSAGVVAEVGSSAIASMARERPKIRSARVSIRGRGRRCPAVSKGSGCAPSSAGDMARWRARGDETISSSSVGRSKVLPIVLQLKNSLLEGPVQPARLVRATTRYKPTAVASHHRFPVLIVGGSLSLVGTCKEEPRVPGETLDLQDEGDDAGDEDRGHRQRDHRKFAKDPQVEGPNGHGGHLPIHHVQTEEVADVLRGARIRGLLKHGSELLSQSAHFGLLPQDHLVVELPQREKEENEAQEDQAR